MSLFGPLVDRPRRLGSRFTEDSLNKNRIIASTVLVGTSKDVQGDRAGERGRWSWIINKLKDLGSGAWNKLKDAARAGYDAFKKAYERYVPWLVRKAIEVGATVYEVYSAVRDFIGL